MWAMTVVNEKSRVPPLDEAALDRLSDALDHESVVAALLVGLHCGAAFGRRYRCRHCAAARRARSRHAAADEGRPLWSTLTRSRHVSNAWSRCSSGWTRCVMP